MTPVDRDSRARRLYGALAALLYLAVIALLILTVHFSMERTEPMPEDILVDFGTTETGAGETDPVVQDAPADPAPAAAQTGPEDVLTQNTDPAPAVPPRQANPQALFPGRTAGNTSSSQGTTEGPGNQGATTENRDWNLDGRSLVGSLPVPDYPSREEGRVIIEIHVDQQGNVTRTAFRSRGSTTTHTALVAAAERAAKRARFNVDETAPFPQVGTITYNFRIRQ